MDVKMKEFLKNAAIVAGTAIGGYLLADAPDVSEKNKHPGTVASIAAAVTTLALANKKGLQKVGHSIHEALMPSVHDTSNTRYDDLPDSVVDVNHTVAESQTQRDTVTLKSAQAKLSGLKKGLGL